MTWRMLFIALPAFTIIAALLASCNNDGRLTADEYFGELQAISDRADARFQPLTEGINQDFSSEAEKIAAWEDFFSADLEILNDYLAEVRDLKPPAELEVEHRQFIQTGEELVQAISETADRIGDVQTTADLEQLLESPTLDEQTRRFDSACLELQEAADSREIQVDLDCE